MMKISAHRGGSEHAAAAMYGAYEDALASGAEYAEFDIRKTRDDVLAVYHDARLPHAGARVADVSYEELCSRVGYIVPKVHDVMEIIAGRMIGHLDLKEFGYEEDVIRMATSILGNDNFIATTLEDESIIAIKRSFPAVRTALSLGRDLGEVPRSRRVGIRQSEVFPIRRLRNCGADWAAINYKLARLGVIKACKQRGIGIMVWTVDPDSMISQFLSDQRIEVLITNRPYYAVCARSGECDE